MEIICKSSICFLIFENLYITVQLAINFTELKVYKLKFEQRAFVRPVTGEC